MLWAEEDGCVQHRRSGRTVSLPLPPLSLTLRGLGLHSAVFGCACYCCLFTVMACSAAWLYYALRRCTAQCGATKLRRYTTPAREPARRESHTRALSARQAKGLGSHLPRHVCGRLLNCRKSDKEDSANMAQTRHGCIHGPRCFQAEEQRWQVEVRTTFLLYAVLVIQLLLLSESGCERLARLGRRT